jgi:radical SAM superfamily enzyme YgiQ (UPF0313 family)
VVVYTKILKKLYPEVPVIIGGIEASLRRVTHYDYWQDQLKPSILAESGADILVYGMAEQPLSQLLKLLDKNIPVSSLITIPQTAVFIAYNNPANGCPACRRSFNTEKQKLGNIQISFA